eukprot:7388026-Prymnesium_polylepis.1
MTPGTIITHMKQAHRVCKHGGKRALRLVHGGFTIKSTNGEPGCHMSVWRRRGGVRRRVNRTHCPTSQVLCRLLPHTSRAPAPRRCAPPTPLTLDCVRCFFLAARLGLEIDHASAFTGVGRARAAFRPARVGGSWYGHHVPLPRLHRRVIGQCILPTFCHHRCARDCRPPWTPAHPQHPARAPSR